MAAVNPCHDVPTRRDYVKYGGAVVGGGLLAGCAGQSDGGSTPPDTRTATDAASATATPTSVDARYTVHIEPTGDITFESPPERALAYSSNYGDMLVALGQSDRFMATTDDSYVSYPYADLEIDFSPEQLSVTTVDGKEALYELNPDIIHIDPNIMIQWFGFDEADIEEVSENIAPWAANYIRRRGDEWHDYPYYTLYEAFEKIATVYQQQDRYEAFKTLHDGVISDVQSRLPGAEERPTVGLLTLGSDTEQGDIVGLPIEQQLGKKQYADLKIGDAFGTLDTDGPFYKMDYEGLLEINPETIVVHWGMLLSEEKFQTQFVKPMKEDAVASEVAAVKNDRIFRGGTANQGPIVNLANTELAAQQLYPDEFGGERLYDRQRIAAIVAGNL